MNNLFHIKRVEFTELVALNNLIFLNNDSCRLTSNINFTEINIIELADVKVEESYENGQIFYTTNLTYKTTDKTPIRKRRIGYRLTTVDGLTFLVGTCSRPYPIIKESNPFPGKTSESSLKTVNVSWQSVHPMLLIC